MFNKLIAVITYIVAKEQQLEGYSALALVWGGEEGRTDTKGHTRTSARVSPIKAILGIPPARAEFEQLFKSAHGAAANFAATVNDFFLNLKEIREQLKDATLSKKERQALELELQRRQMARSLAMEKFEQAFLTLEVPATAGWTFSLSPKTGRLLAGNPQSNNILETDPYFAELKNILKDS